MEATVTQPLNAAQIELLNSVAHIDSEEDLRELKHALSMLPLTIGKRTNMGD